MSSETIHGIHRLSGNRVLARSPGKPRYASVERAPALIRWTFLLFAFLLPFESAELPFTSSLTSTKMVGVVFAALYFLYYNPLWGKRPLPVFTPPMWCFLVYFCIAALNGVALPKEFQKEFIVHIMTMTQLIILFWISSSLFQDEKITKQTYLVYVIGSFILALGIIFDIPGLSAGVDEEGRAVALRASSNLLALIMVPAALIPMGIFLNSRLHFTIRFSLLGLIPPMLILLVQTGSRAGVGAFFIGSLLFLVPHKGSRRQLTAMALAIVGAVGLVYMVAQDPLSSERWLATYYEGDTASRDRIVPATLEMISERPLLGWQPTAAFFELGRRLGLGKRKDAHNLFLYVFLEVGLIGFVPFTIGVLWCCWSAWKGRGGSMGIMPAVILSSVLAFTMTHSGIKHKANWIFLALGVAVGSVAEKKRQKIVLKATPRHGYIAVRVSDASATG